MNNAPTGSLARFRNRVGPILAGPPVLAFLPAVTLGSFWLGGETALIVAALCLPVVFALIGGFAPKSGGDVLPRDSVTGLMLRDGFKMTADSVFQKTATSGLRSACFVLEIDDYRELVERHGQAAADLVAGGVFGYGGMKMTGQRRRVSSWRRRRASMSWWRANIRAR